MNTPASSTVSGELYLITTPIGNLDDMTIRAIETLKSCDLVFAEDTRHTRILFNHFEITARLDSYHAFNEHGKTRRVLDKVLAGLKVGLVTDAGTPCVADPGYLLVREAVKLGIQPKVIPGVSALTFAIAASGLPSDRFIFQGFLPVKSGRRSARIAEIAAENKTSVIFESPYRISKTLAAIAEIAPDCRLALIREATKFHEEIIRGSAAELAALKREWKGEFVIGLNNSAKKGDSGSGEEE